MIRSILSICLLGFILILNTGFSSAMEIDSVWNKIKNEDTPHHERKDLSIDFLSRAESLQDEKAYYEVKYIYALLLTREGLYEEASDALGELRIHSLNQKNDTLLLWVDNLQSSIYRFNGQFYEALNILHEAYDKIKQNNLLRCLPKTANNLGIVYRNLKDIPRAIELYEEAMEYAIQFADTNQIITAYLNQGNLKWFQNQNEQARSLYKKALHLSLTTNNHHQTIAVYNNIANSYRDDGNYDLAMEYYAMALALYEPYRIRGLHAVILRNTGITHKRQKQWEQALDFIDQSIEITEDIGLKGFSRDNYMVKSNILKELGDTELAFEYLTAFNQLNQEIYNQQLLNNISYFNERIYEAKKEKEVFRFKWERNILFIILAIIAFASLIAFSMLSAKRVKDKKRSIDRLKFTLEAKEKTQLALVQSQENYQTLLRALNEGLIVLDKEFNIELINETACSVLECAEKESVMGKSFGDYLFSPDDETLFKERMQIQEMGMSDRFEVRLRSAKKDMIWSHLSVAPILDEMQVARSYAILLSDISERKQAEEHLSDLTSNLNQKIKQINCLYDISDISGVPGISFDEVIKKSLEIIPIGLRYSHDVVVEIVFDDKRYASPNFIETPWSYTVPIKVQKKKLGHIKLAYLEEKPNVNKDPFHFNEKILIKNISEKLGQIVESKKMEMSLIESQEHLQEVQRLARIGNWEVFLKDEKIVFSDFFFNILSVPIEKRKFFDFDKFVEMIHPEDVSVVLKSRNLYSSDDQEVLNFNFRLIDQKGDIIYIYSSRKTAFNEKGEPERLVFTIQDITEQKINQELKNNAEIALKTSEAKQQFLANMSHEMRTPMNGIVGMIDFLQKTKLTQKQADYVQTLKCSSESLLNIINDVLDLSKIEAGKLKLKRHSFSLESISCKIRGLFVALSKHKDLKLQIHQDDSIPPYIESDEYRIYQIITNLVSNAVKFTEKGTISVSFKLKELMNEEILIQAEVKDSGSGIQPEQLDQLFKAYSQLDDSKDRILEGTGLGLAISKKLVSLLGGEIWVENNSNGIGCTFYFYFRARVTANDLSSQKNSLSAQDIKESLKGMRILCVDDKSVNLKVLNIMLSYVGCAVEQASSGADAIDKLNKKEFDVVLMDIVMPDMDGVETMEVIKKTFANPPVIIAASANALEGDREQYINAGMDDYISKPISSDELYEKLAKIRKQNKD